MLKRKVIPVGSKAASPSKVDPAKRFLNGNIFPCFNKRLFFDIEVFVGFFVLRGLKKFSGQRNTMTVGVAAILLRASSVYFLVVAEAMFNRSLFGLDFFMFLRFFCIYFIGFFVC